MGAEDLSATYDAVVHRMEGDCTVLCVVVATNKRAVIVVNSGYSHAIEHAQAHLCAGGQRVWICSPECSGA